MAKPKLLIIDDEAEVRKCLKAYLSKKVACTIQTASDGKKALEKMKKTRFDVALVDIKMAGLSGIDVIREAAKVSAQTKMLVISAYDSQDIADVALKTGALDYIPKSYSLEQVGVKVKRALAEAGK